MPFSTLSSLESGASLSFSGKEIEIMEEIAKEAVTEFKKAAVAEKSKRYLTKICRSKRFRQIFR